MAFLKARFPIEFYIPLLNSSIGSNRTTELYINELKERDIAFSGPSINTSKEKYYNANRKIYMPLICLKGLGMVMNKKIVKEREDNGQYKSFLDFVIRAVKIGVSTLILETLIKANTLAQFGNVNSLLLSLAPALRFAKMVIIKKDDKLIIDTSIISTPLLIKAERNIPEEVKYQKYYFGFPVSTFITDNPNYPSKLKDLTLNKELQIVAQIK
jgi:DNA polymerase-3 subunit alpha